MRVDFFGDRSGRSRQSRDLTDQSTAARACTKCRGFRRAIFFRLRSRRLARDADYLRRDYRPRASARRFPGGNVTDVAPGAARSSPPAPGITSVTIDGCPRRALPRSARWPPSKRALPGDESPNGATTLAQDLQLRASSCGVTVLPLAAPRTAHDLATSTAALVGSALIGSPGTTIRVEHAVGVDHRREQVVIVLELARKRRRQLARPQALQLGQ